MNLWREPLDTADFKPPTGKVVVIKERCKGCDLCVHYCPYDFLKLSKAFNAKGYHYPEPVEAAACIDCQFCESICPEFAIFTVGTRATRRAV
jgi:2-oxoglutarate ferredoxin oxidoreductase subunit delta